MMPNVTRATRLSDDAISLTVQHCVEDPGSGKRYVIVIRRVDLRPVRAAVIHGVARLTAKNVPPGETGDILLRTPWFYRKMENGDDLDWTSPSRNGPLLVSWIRQVQIPPALDILPEPLDRPASGYRDKLPRGACKPHLSNGEFVTGFLENVQG